MQKTLSSTAKNADQMQHLVRENADLRDENSSLKRQLDWLKRQIFGRKSEKRLIQNPDQLDFGSCFEAPDLDKAPEPQTQQIAYTRKKQRKDTCVTDEGLRFDDSVPVEVIELKAPELEGETADQYEVIDYKITRRLAQRPGSYLVLEYRRPVVKHKPSQSLTTVPAPSAIFDKCLADVTLLAGILVDKFAYHLPLYRQHQRLKDAGIQLSRTTLTYYVQRAIDLLNPIFLAQLKNILLSKILAMDETPIKSGRKAKGKMQTAWYWPIYGDAHEVCFTWSPSRGSDHLKPLLADFQGTLLTDGHAAYDAFAKDKPQITQAQCWVHTRRYFEKALDSDPAAEVAMNLIGQLYQVEDRIREKHASPQEKLNHRLTHSQPIVTAFFELVHQQRSRMDLTNSHPLSKALVYAAKREAQLKIFLGDPDLPLDTNHLERALRVIPMGRKNWLFCWTEAGAEQVGIIQSLITTCRLHDIDPYTYLVDVLQRVSLHPAKDVIDLTPRVWKEKFSHNPLRSDLFGLGQ